MSRANSLKDKDKEVLKAHANIKRVLSRDHNFLNSNANDLEALLHSSGFSFLADGTQPVFLLTPQTNLLRGVGMLSTIKDILLGLSLSGQPLRVSSYGCSYGHDAYMVMCYIQSFKQRKKRFSRVRS